MRVLSVVAVVAVLALAACQAADVTGPGAVKVQGAAAFGQEVCGIADPDCGQGGGGKPKVIRTGPPPETCKRIASRAGESIPKETLSAICR